MNNAADLQQLRDIHLPPPIGWWPPAPGWWLLLVLALGLIAAIVVWLLRYRKQNRYRRLALKQLQQLRGQWQQTRDEHALAQALNQLLKQTALAAYPRERVAALSGADWLLFLDSGLKQPRFSEPELRALAATYQRAPEPVAPERLFDAAAHWIRRHRC